MYYRDLSDYEYLDREHGAQGEETSKVLNVGWLDEKHSFNTGEVSDEFKDRLLYLCCCERHNLTRGFHQSWLVPYRSNIYPEKWGCKVTYKGQSYMLGSAEIRVRRDENCAFASPNMIYHYVIDAKYLPPQEFIDAVLRMKMPKE